MNSQSTSQPRFHADGIALAVLFAVVPLAFFPRMNDVFVLDKAYLAIAALVFLVAGFGLETRRRLWISPIFKWASVFLGWMLLSSLCTARAPGEILAGSTHLWIFVGALAVALASGPGLHRKAHFFLKAGSWCVGLLGLAQALGLDFGIDWTAKFDNRVFSTFGNPNYLAGYLAVLWPIACVDFLKAVGLRAKVWEAAHLALLTAVFALAAVRGAFLGLGVGLALMAVYGVVRPEGRALFRRYLKVGWALILVLAIAVAALMARQGGWDSFSLSGETAHQRLETWRVTEKMIQDHPWVGVGLGNFKVQYPSYQWRTQKADPILGVTAPYTVTDHAHNEFLQVMAEGGLPGLVLFLCLWGFALWKLFRRGASGPEGIFNWEVAAALGVCGSALGFSFSNFPLQLAPVALIAGWTLASAETRERSHRPPEALGRLTGWSLAVLGLFLIVITASVTGSVAYRDTVGEAGLENMEPATRYADRLMALSPDRYRVYYESGQAFSQAGSAYIVRMGEAFDQAIRCNPIDPEIRLGKATQLFRTGQFDKALEQADKGLALAPNLHGLQFVRGSALFQLKRYRESEAAFTQASRLLPTDFDTWLNLGVAQVLQGEKTEATQSWAQALVLRPRDVRVIDYLESLEKK